MDSTLKSGRGTLRANLSAGVAMLLKDGWSIYQHSETDEELHLWAEFLPEPDTCPKCGVVGAKFNSHGGESVPYTEAPTFGLRCTVFALVKRLKCLECGKTFMQPLTEIAPRRRMTMRCLRYIERRAGTETWAKIARDVGVDEKTVRQIAKDAAARAHEEWRQGLHAPLVLGIDELKLDGELRTIMVDGGNRRVLDILESRDKVLVHRWLSWLPARWRTRIVTMDMYSPYLDAVKLTMPEATIIVDRWHVQKKINDALDLVRVRLRDGLKSKKARKEAMRGRRLLHRSRHRLKPRAAFVLQGWLANNPVLKDAWETKERFYDVWEAKTAAEAEAAFQAARETIPESVKPEFEEFCKTVERWREHIFPFFEMGFTNAYTEAANGIIKMANRAGRGYRFEQIRARALAPRPPAKDLHYICEECTKRFRPNEMTVYVFDTTLCPDCQAVHIERIRKMLHDSPP